MPISLTTSLLTCLGVTAVLGAVVLLRPNPMGSSHVLPARDWRPVGLSGGGAMFAPAVSPSDPKRMMLNCDMSGAYVTADGGRTWRMINSAELHANTRCRPAFHPTDSNILYAADGGQGMK